MEDLLVSTRKVGQTGMGAIVATAQSQALDLAREPDLTREHHHLHLHHQHQQVTTPSRVSSPRGLDLHLDRHRYLHAYLSTHVTRQGGRENVSGA